MEGRIRAGLSLALILPEIPWRILERSSNPSGERGRAMSSATVSTEQSSDTQGRFRKWLLGLRGQNAKENFSIERTEWRIQKVTTFNPGTVKEPNLRTVNLGLVEEGADQASSRSGERPLRQLHFTVRVDKNQVAVLSDLSGKKAVTDQFRPTSLFEREEFLREMDSLLDENAFLRRQVSELRMAIQSMIEAKPQLPHRSS